MFEDEIPCQDAGEQSPRPIYGAEDRWAKFAAQVGAQQQVAGCPMASEIVVEPVTYTQRTQPYDPPRYRLCGKQQPPALRATRAGGEWMDDVTEDMAIEGLKLLQHHRGLKELVQEEASRLQGGGGMEIDCQVLQEVQRSLHQLEKELTEAGEAWRTGTMIRSLKVEEEEVLQTQTISQFGSGEKELGGMDTGIQD